MTDEYDDEKPQGSALWTQLNKVTIVVVPLLVLWAARTTRMMFAMQEQILSLQHTLAESGYPLHVVEAKEKNGEHLPTE